MKILFVFVCAIFLALDRVEATPGRVVCYYESWVTYRIGKGQFGVANIDPNLCTHIIYAFVNLQTDGSITVADSWLDLDSGLGSLRKFTALKNQNPALKTLAAIGGWTARSTAFTQVAANANSRNNFVYNAVKFLKSYNFDGLDIDWEYPTQNGGQPADYVNFVTLLQQLRTAFTANNLLLTAAVGATKTALVNYYNVAALAKNLDMLNLMTYDLHGSWEGVTGEVAPLYRSPREPVTSQLNVDNCVTSWLQAGMPSTKINLGIPTYGRTFTLANPSNNGIGAPSTGLGNPGPYSREAGTMSYLEIVELQKNSSNWKVVWNRDQAVPYMYNGNQWIGYDNKDSTINKVSYAINKHLGGVMFWAMDIDDFRGISGTKFAMISTAKKALATYSF